MGARGDQKQVREAKKANLTQKKKFKDRNSIGKTRKKVGSVGRYTTRTQAVKKLQARTHHPHTAAVRHAGGRRAALSQRASGAHGR